MSYATARDLDFSEIPVIDVAGLRGGAPGALSEVAARILEASARSGFFYIEGHGVPEARIAAALAQARAFFARPLEEKRRVAVDPRHRGFMALGGARMYAGARSDLKESFNWGLELAADDPAVRAGEPLMGPNRWPDDMPGFREALYGYYEAVLDCGRDLLRAFAVGLGIDEDFFLARYRKPLARGSALYYPPQPADLGREQFGVGAHSDYGCLTLLWQDPTGGLQVRNRAGEWIAAPPLAGTFVVNVGDLLSRWSNDRFASTPHRVVNASGRARYSLAVFFDPDADAVVDPRDCALPPGEAPRYEPIRAGDHIRARFDAAFAYRQAEGAPK